MSEAEKWRSVKARDASADGKFVTAIRTTGIYCRPSCPSRHPKKENVEFYPSPEAAELAGYRPCLRCKPRDRDAPQLAWVKKACDYIRCHPKEKITLNTLTKVVGINAYHIQRTFKRIMGMSPHQYQETCRIELLKGQLRKGESVNKAVYNTGYGSTSWLYKDPYAKLGMTPGAYKRRGEGMKIRYMLVPSPLGKLMVARTRHGVCYIGLWDDEVVLEKSLFEEYPLADLKRKIGRLDHWTRSVLRYLEGRVSELGGIPIDVGGTEFQQRVWKELQNIPVGQTRTYGDIARSIGRPNAFRAVGKACSVNPVSILIPCHRVVGESGGLHGYHWGVDRKKALQDSERIRV